MLRPDVPHEPDPGARAPRGVRGDETAARRVRGEAATGRARRYLVFPVLSFFQQFNPYVQSQTLGKFTAIGKYNLEKSAAKRHALRKARSMREHIGLLKDEIKDVHKAKHLTTFFKTQAQSSNRSQARNLRDDNPTAEETLIHVDAIVAHHEGADSLLVGNEEPEFTPPIFGSGRAVKRAEKQRAKKPSPALPSIGEDASFHETDGPDVEAPPPNEDEPLTSREESKT